MADKKIFIADGPKKGKVPRAPFDLTFTSNITGKFGQVQCAMMKYYPAGSKLRIRPHFVYDMMPFVYPIQTNVRCHVKLYKVPLRILCKDFEDFTCQLGQDGTPVNSGSFPFVMPYIKRSFGWNSKGSLAEQIGCSNITLKDREALEDFSFIRSIGSFSGGYFVSSNTLNSGNMFARVKYPINSIPHLHPFDSNVGDITVRFRFIDDNPSVSSPDIGGIRAYVVVKLPNDDDSYFGLPYGEHNEYAYRFVYASDVCTRSLTSVQFKAAVSSKYFITGNTQRVVSGTTLYEHFLYYKLVDDTFYTKYFEARKAGYDVQVFYEFTEGLSSLMYRYSQSLDNVEVISFESYKPDSYDSQSNKINTTSSRQILRFNAGLVPSASFSTLQFYNSYHTYFDSVDGADPVQPVSALPFRALEFIHNYFMRKPRIDPFMKDGVPSYNKFITNDGSGADETTPVESWNALLEDDYFTTCVKEPQFGNAPLVGVTVNDTSDTGILTFADDGNFNNYTVKLDIDQNGHVLPLTAYSDNADRPNVHRLQELINFGISINDLRNVSTFQRMLERMQRSVTAGGSAYANYMYEFFGTNPPIGDHYPQYLGGITRNLQVSKITNVAKSEHANLGEFAGQGRFEGKGKWIKCFLTEPSYIVAIQYFTITPTYSQYTPKHLFYKDPLDFYLNPDFATVAPQPVYKKEVAIGALEPNQLDDVFGYNRPYAELVSNVDEVHGEFRDSMANFLLQRMFGKGQVNLNKSFIEVDPQQYLNIFSVVENTDKIYGQCMFEISGSLPLPRSYTPHTI